MQFAFLFPEPKCGYDKFLRYDEQYVKLFSVLSKPNALKALYFLAGRYGTMFFKKDTLMHELVISAENAGEIIKNFCEVGFGKLPSTAATAVRRYISTFRGVSLSRSLQLRDTS